MRKLTCWLIGFWAVVGTNGACFGATIHVDQSGGGDYTTIEAGINAALPNDTVKVGPGVYSENVVIDKDIFLIGSGPDYTIIRASLTGIKVQQHITTEISNFTVTAGGHGISFTEYITCTVKNCIVVGCGASGIYYNRGHRNFLTITNNTIVYNNTDGIHVRWDGNSGAVLGIVNIQGNIIAYNGGDGLDLVETTENISYNNVFGNTTNYRDCAPGTGDISFDPLFIDQNAGNYALQSTSHCVDGGIPGETFNDPDGSRNDMGAFSGPPSAAFWPYIARGPAVTEIILTPASVPRGGTITIQAKGRVQ